MGMGMGGRRVVAEPPALASTRPAQSSLIRYSDQQQAIIHSKGDLVVADAFAGCGKTTTAVGLCEANPKERILYLVLNTANAAEARARFPTNVRALTMHSLAWADPGIRKAVGERLAKSWRAMVVKTEFDIDARRAYLAQKVLASFWASTDEHIGEQHVDALREKQDLSDRDADYAVMDARAMWRRMLDPNDRCSIPHDAYLKMFVMRCKGLDYDRVIMDEAQDANPLSMQLLGKRSAAKLVCIGDRHQSIYLFRGAMNAMEKLSEGADRYHLTQTYRFGPKIAAIANTILGDLKGETAKIEGLGRDKPWRGTSPTRLARTNAQLFAIAAERMGEGVNWVGKTSGRNGEYVVGVDGPDKYGLSALEDVYCLYANQHHKIKNPALRSMNYQSYVADSEASQDAEGKIMVKLIEQHRHDTPALVESLRTQAVADPKDAQMLITTAHKSKGLEWDEVQIENDFEFLKEIEDNMATLSQPMSAEQAQEVNLLYVAATRAQSAVKLNQETQDWLDNIDEHRNDRRLARVRAQQGSRHVRDGAAL